MTITYMTSGAPKSWDKTLRVYEITFPSGQKMRWNDITARECLTKYEYLNAMNKYKCELREVTGKELQLQKIMDK